MTLDTHTYNSRNQLQVPIDLRLEVVAITAELTNRETNVRSDALHEAERVVNGLFT